MERFILSNIVPTVIATASCIGICRVIDKYFEYRSFKSEEDRKKAVKDCEQKFKRKLVLKHRYE